MPAGHDYELYYCLFEGDTGGYYLASQYNVNGKWKIWEGDTNAISSLSGTVNYSKNLIVYPYNTLIWIAEIRDVKDGQVYARYWQYSNEGPNLALSPIMTVTASSEYNSNFGAKSAVDGISGVWDANEWASNGEMTPWIKLNWYVPQYMNKVVLYDRCNPIDHIKDAWLRFYKFNKLVKEIHVGMMPYGGGAREIVFNQLKADTIILNVTDGDGLNIGLSEFVVFNDTTLNIAKNSDFVSSCNEITASSEYNSGYSAICAGDGIYGAWDANEWASNGEMTPWIKFRWDSAKKINKVVLYDRCNPFDHILDAWLCLKKDKVIIKSIHLGMFPYGGGAKEVIFDSIVVDEIYLDIVEGAGLNIGLSELQIFYDKTINMNNLSTQENGCVVTASSEYSPNYRKECVIDGIYGAWDANEWASNGEKAGAWIQLNWPDDPQSINTIVLYDRSNPYDHITDAWLIITKQDSSIINKHIGQFPFGGASKELYLTKDEGTNISALQIFITDAAPSTLNVGLSEIQCYRDTSRW